MPRAPAGGADASASSCCCSARAARIRSRAASNSRCRSARKRKRRRREDFGIARPERRLDGDAGNARRDGRRFRDAPPRGHASARRTAPDNRFEPPPGCARQRQPPPRGALQGLVGRGAALAPFLRRRAGFAPRVFDAAFPTGFFLAAVFLAADFFAVFFAAAFAFLRLGLVFIRTAVSSRRAERAIGDRARRCGCGRRCGRRGRGLRSRRCLRRGFLWCRFLGCRCLRG